MNKNNAKTFLKLEKEVTKIWVKKIKKLKLLMTYLANTNSSSLRIEDIAEFKALNNFFKNKIDFINDITEKHFSFIVSDFLLVAKEFEVNKLKRFGYKADIKVIKMMNFHVKQFDQYSNTAHKAITNGEHLTQEFIDEISIHSFAIDGLIDIYELSVRHFKFLNAIHDNPGVDFLKISHENPGVNRIGDSLSTWAKETRNSRCGMIDQMQYLADSHLKEEFDKLKMQ